MPGMSRATGAALGGLNHIVQSIGDILTTPLNTRVMRRDYGSRLTDLLDRPQNADLLIEVYAAVAEALGKWEPRFRLRRIAARLAADGHARLTLTGDLVADGQAVTLEGIEV